MFFEDAKQDLGFANWEAHHSTSARRHWQLVTLAYSLRWLHPADSAVSTICQKATSFRAEGEHSLKEAIFNLVTWVRENRDRAIDQIMAKFDASCGYVVAAWSR